MEKENKKQLFQEIEELRTRLQEAEETLSAIRSGEVDAIVVSGPQGEQVFTLTGAEQAYRVVIETMNEGAASVNQEGRIIYCNQRLSEMIKTPLEKVIGASMRQFVRASDLPVFDSLIEKGLQKSSKGEISFIKNDGTVLPVLLFISALRRGNPNMCSIVVTDLTTQKHVEDELKRHRDHLEELVRESTYELDASNQLLQEEITERKQKEKKILNLAREWQKTFDAIPASVFLLNLEGRITRCNKATELLLGKAQDEIIGLPCWELMHGTDKPIPECPIPAMKKDRKRKSVVIPAENRWLQITVDPIFDDVGELVGAVHTTDDVTERKKAEDALQEANEFNRQVIESAQEGLIVYGPDLKYQVWNLFMEEFIGLSASEVLGRHPLEIFPFLREVGVMAAIEKALAGEICEAVCFQFRIPQTGRLGWISDINVPLRNGRGEIIGVIGTVRNITESKREEEKLRKSEEFTKKILESVDQGFIVIDLEYRVIAANRAYRNSVGKPLEDIIGKHCYELSHHLDKPCCEEGTTVCPVTLTFKTGEHYSSIHTHYDNTGAPVYVETKSYPLKDKSGKVVSAIEITNDITERKKLEDQLRHAQKMEAVGTLAGGIAHDFNNILNVILGYGTMVMDRIGDDQLLREQMNEVLSAAERAANLTQRLLVFSRKQVVDVHPINIDELILGLQKMLVRIIRESIDFKLDLADKPVMVLADAGQIEQVLINLVANARDAMPESGRLTISTGTKEMDDEYITACGYGKPGMYAFITVADTGQGMDEETQKKIFEPFFTTKGIGEGTGLGLAISYGIIKQHNGYIKVCSEIGKGTTFKIWLPIIEDIVEKKPEAEAVSYSKGGTETILVAEDDASLRKLSRIVLESSGYSVITAEDGEDAITKFMENRERISLVLLDMIMPKKNGKEVGEVIREVSPRTKILFASGYTMDIIHTKELTESGFDFLLKPVVPRDLLKKVREILDK